MPVSWASAVESINAGLLVGWGGLSDSPLNPTKSTPTHKIGRMNLKQSTLHKHSWAVRHYLQWTDAFHVNVGP